MRAAGRKGRRWHGAPRPSIRRPRPPPARAAVAGTARTRGGPPAAARRGRLGDDVEPVHLAVGVGDGGADLGAPVLEHQHVVDVVARAEGLGAIGPQVDDPGHALAAQLPQAGVVVGRVEHDLGPAACERRPPVGERPGRVRLGRLEAADAERAAVGRQVGPPLAARATEHRAPLSSSKRRSARSTVAASRMARADHGWEARRPSTQPPPPGRRRRGDLTGRSRRQHHASMPHRPRQRRRDRTTRPSATRPTPRSCCWSWASAPRLSTGTPSCAG